MLETVQRRQEPSNRLLTGWRRVVAGEEMLELLRGERSLRVGPNGHLVVDRLGEGDSAGSHVLHAPGRLISTQATEKRGTMLYTTFDSPVGELVLVGDKQALHGLYMQGGRTAVAVRDEWERDESRSPASREQLDEYFAAPAHDVRPAARDGRQPRSSAGSGARCRTSPTGRRSPTASSPAAIGAPGHAARRSARPTAATRSR